MQPLWIVCVAYALKRILFDYLKACQQILPEQEMEKTLMLLTSDIPLYDLQYLNVKMSNKPLTRRILDKDMSSIYGELELSLSYKLKNMIPSSTEMKWIPIGTKKLPYTHYGNHLLVENVNYWFCVVFLTIYCHTFVSLSQENHLSSHVLLLGYWSSFYSVLLLLILSGYCILLFLLIFRFDCQ